MPATAEVPTPGRDHIRIPLSRPEIGEREIEYVTRVLRSGQLSLGPCLAEFEESFAAYAGTRYAVAVNSGTSALHLAVKALGIGPGDEVFTSSFSFVASANCLLYEGARPVFVDIHPDTLNLNPAQLWATIKREYTWEPHNRRLVNRLSGRVAKAILPIHVFGLPCDMAPIVAIAREFNLRILEDACEAVGAEYCGRRVGTFGQAGVFAFYPNKQMTTAEGGMLVTNDSEIARLCRSLRNQGRDDSDGWLHHVRLGYNYRLSDLHAALGLAQLDRIEELLADRARVARAYSARLAGCPLLSIPENAPDAKRSWFVYVIQLQRPSSRPARDRLKAALRARGIASAAYFPPIHRQPYFRGYAPMARSFLPHTEAASGKCLSLPFFSAMTDSQVDEVCAAVIEILSQIHADYAEVQERPIEVARSAF